MRRSAPALIAALLAAGAALAQQAGRLEGRLLLSPAAPLERAGEPNQRGVPGRIEILDAQGTRVAEVSADQNGHFATDLPPGRYTLHLAVPRPGRAADRQVRILAGHVTQTQLIYDAGIR